MLRFFAAIILSLCFYHELYAQHIFHHVQNGGIYDFIDELANASLVEVNSSVKPYSREQISQILVHASERVDELNKRQQAELKFYLKDFGKEIHDSKDFPRRIDLLYYHDTLFRATLNPIIGVDVFKNDNDIAYRRWVGAEGWAYIGKQVGMYASLRDFNENYRLGDRNFLNHYQGGGYKPKGLGGEFSDMRGGVTFRWAWGYIGLAKDNFEWGSGYNGTNIIYSRAPSFTMLKLMIKPARWFELNYIHGWLVSQVIDSSRSYSYAGSKRDVFHPKYIAANFVTVTPLKRLNLSFGNSIIYSDMDIHPAYLTPFFFYKSIDHHLNGMSNWTGQNSQMFLDISSRQIRNLNLYLSFFLDEIALSRMFDPERHSNFLSLKTGFRLSNFPVKNVMLTGEYTRNNPQVYEHINRTTDFESNRFNLGHYLKENSEEIFLALSVKPIRNLSVDLSYTNAKKGPYTSGGETRLGLAFMETIDWSAQIISFRTTFQPFNDVYTYLGVDFSDYNGRVSRYTPAFLHGENITLRIGGCYGF